MTFFVMDKIEKCCLKRVDEQNVLFIVFLAVFYTHGEIPLIFNTIDIISEHCDIFLLAVIQVPLLPSVTSELSIIMCKFSWPY